MFTRRLKRSAKDLLNIKDIESLDNVFARHSDNIGHKAVNGNTVILNLENGAFFSLDEVGSYIWQSMKEEKNLLQIAKDMAHLYNVEQKKVICDLIELVNELIDMDLVAIKRRDNVENLNLKKKEDVDLWKKGMIPEKNPTKSLAKRNIVNLSWFSMEVCGW